MFEKSPEPVKSYIQYLLSRVRKLEIFDVGCSRYVLIGTFLYISDKGPFYA